MEAARKPSELIQDRQPVSPRGRATPTAPHLMGAADQPSKTRQATAECAAGTGDAVLVGPVSADGGRARQSADLDESGSAASTHAVPEDEDRGLTFDQILTKYERKIYNLILRYIGDREEAEDLTQETFVNAYKSFPTFRGECKVQTWLTQIALNQCKNRFRQRDRRRTVEGPSLDAPSGPSDDPVRPMEVADSDQSPQDVLIQRETYRYVLKAINSLPNEYRAVIILCDLQQMSYLEIAQATSLSLEAVKTRIHRGRLMLRRKLDAYLRS